MGDWLEIDGRLVGKIGWRLVGDWWVRLVGDWFEIGG